MQLHVSPDFTGRGNNPKGDSELTRATLLALVDQMASALGLGSSLAELQDKTPP